MNMQHKVYYNLTPGLLVEHALANGEGHLTETGALLVTTGKHTGRSPMDRYIVDTEAVHENIAWGENNRPISRETYCEIKRDMKQYLRSKSTYIFDGFAGADSRYRRKFRIVNELASQNLFMQNLLIRPPQKEAEEYGNPDYTIWVAPYYVCDTQKYRVHSETIIIINLSDHEAIIGGTQYSGEIKKAVFTIMNYVMPMEEKVLPMHCSVNIDPQSGKTAAFFGLSGTGKTTLSSVSGRKLIGDDEHGWSGKGLFNFEGGCYAKCIDLEKEDEPEIYDAIRYGTVVENVIMDSESGTLDYKDRTLTENTRAGYPLEYIKNIQKPSVGAAPETIFFLTADAYGVLPPISRLSTEAAIYQFVTGFTAKVAGTEDGIIEPVPTFSALFGEPFMIMPVYIYAEMFKERIVSNETSVYLVNTGWIGGSYGTGSRIKLQCTRALIDAALSGELDNTPSYHDHRFNLDVPKRCTGVSSDILNPKNLWKDKDAYDIVADHLAKRFEENFRKKYADMPESIIHAGPSPLF